MSEPTTRNATPASIVDQSQTFKPEIVRATRALARSKPWQGTFSERREKVELWLAAAESAYDLKPITLTHAGPQVGCSGRSTVSADGLTIRLSGRMSVVTVFQLFHKCRQLQQEGAINHRRAMVWAATLFARRFPISFSRCRLVNGLLVNDGLVARESSQA